MFPLLLIVIALLGLAKCAVIARRPTANRRCVVALMALLGAWLCAVGVSGLMILVPELGPGALFLSILPLALLVGAVVLACQGLKECARSKNFYTHGPNQAFLALVFSGILLLVIGAVMFNELSQGLSAGDHRLGGRPLVFEKLNFKLIHPGPRWTDVAANEWDTNAAVALRRTKPDLTFILVAHPMSSTNVAVDVLATQVLTTQSNAMAGTKVTYRGPTAFGQDKALQVHGEAAPAGQKVYFRQLLVLTPAQGYQFAMWGPNSKAVGMELDYLVSRFQVLDPGRGLPVLKLPSPASPTF